MALVLFNFQTQEVKQRNGRSYVILARDNPSFPDLNSCWIALWKSTALYLKISQGRTDRHMHIAPEKLEADVPCKPAYANTMFMICNAGNEAKKASDVKAVAFWKN